MKGTFNEICGLEFSTKDEERDDVVVVDEDDDISAGRRERNRIKATTTATTVGIAKEVLPKLSYTLSSFLVSFITILSFLYGIKFKMQFFI